MQWNRPDCGTSAPNIRIGQTMNGRLTGPGTVDADLPRGQPPPAAEMNADGACP